MNNTLHNGFRVLEYLADSAEAVSVKELAEHFELPGSHICRLLKSLTEIGYVEQLSGSRKYRISLKILNLANARLKKERLWELSRPYLRQLAEKYSAAVFVTRIWCGRSLIIGTDAPPLFADSNASMIGTLHSPTSSACGKVCAAYASEDVRAALLEEIDWQKPGDFQNRRNDFESELIRIRQQGFAVRDLQGAVGVPLFEGNGQLNGALGVMLPAVRSRTDELWHEVIESTLSCGKLISFAQGCSLEGYPNYNKTIRRKK